jgi:pSer/pThr/pTyr-binding forkhead associated (FHA) protein
MMRELFLVIRFKSMFDRIHHVDSAETLIGRDATCQICVSDLFVSRNHAVVLKTDRDFRIRDLNSRNGTRLNGTPVCADEQLHDGSEMRIGPYVFQVCSSLAKAVHDTAGSDESTRTEKVGSNSQKPDAPGMSVLTPAQHRVYELLLHGLIEKEVATRLKISVHTVHDHTKAIYKALSVSTRGELFSRRETQHD